MKTCFCNKDCHPSCMCDACHDCLIDSPIMTPEELGTPVGSYTVEINYPKE